MAGSLKHIFQPDPSVHQDRHRTRLCFVLTGSGAGVVLTFHAFRAMPPNGTLFLGRCRFLFVKLNQNEKVAARMQEILGHIRSLYY